MEKIKAILSSNIISSNSKLAFDLNSNQNFGDKSAEKVIYNIYESAYLMEFSKLELFFKDKKISNIDFLNKVDKNFALKYLVFKDLRKKYIVKTALKFGADFRVYDKQGLKRNHAKWLVYIVSENSNAKWQEFSAKNRVAHSTNKKLLIALVDSEAKINYYECNWIKP